MAVPSSPSPPSPRGGRAGAERQVPSPSTLPQTAAKSVGRQLTRICASATFRGAGRLRRFLEFIVKEELAGRGDQLKEYVVGVAVFDKTPAFDPRNDPIVRVQARRLRAMLERYYGEEAGPDEPVIELPKGGYAPVFSQREAQPARATWALALANRNTVAVSALADHSVSGDLQSFREGLRQEILHCLAQIPGLHVLADDAHGNESARTALIVNGSVRKAGDTVRTILQVVDGVSGCLLWSGSMDSVLGEALTAQRDAALTLSAQVRTHLDELSGRRTDHKPLANPAARHLYLQGRYHLGQRTEEGLRKAAEFFERALMEDPGCALAHSGLADAYSLLGHYGVLAPAEVWTKAAASATTAVMLGPDSAETQTTLAHVKACQDWDWAGAESQFRHALLLDPAYATTHHWYATSCLAPLGRLSEALEEMRVAQSLDPISSIIARDLAFMHYYRREFDLALEQCDHTIELNPYFSPAFCTLGLIQEQRQDMEEAIAAFQRAIHLSPSTPSMHAALGHLYALTGNRKRAEEAIATLSQLSSSRYVSPFEFAAIYFALGQSDAGFQWLTKACADRSFELLFINVDPRFDAVRRDPRFAAVARKLKLMVPSPTLRASTPRTKKRMPRASS